MSNLTLDFSDASCSVFILLLVVGWISSGQFSNNVVAQDESTKEVSDSEISYSENSKNNESE